MQSLNFFRKKRGFSLIELMVTVAIIGIAIVPIMMSYVRTWQTTIAAKRLTIATMLARKEIEKLQATTSFGNMSTGNTTGNFTGAHDDYSWKRKISKLNGSSNSYNAKKIQIRVNYNSILTGSKRSVTCSKVSACDSWDYSKVVTKLSP